MEVVQWHHSSSSKSKDEDEGSSFGTVVTWLAVLIGLGVVAYAALTIGKPSRGARIPPAGHAAARRAPIEHRSTTGRVLLLSSSSRESMIDENKPGAVV